MPDRALSMPKGWTDDAAPPGGGPCAGGVFATKPAIALSMIERAIAAGVPFNWVAADSVYGVGGVETALRRAGKGYGLGVNATHHFRSWAKPQAIAGTAEDIAAACPKPADAACRRATGPRASSCMTGPVSTWLISTPANTTALSPTPGHAGC